ncbi:hypothetical protein IT575_14150 [bacterium]|nr:hypothetical protein [bacterium]
MRLAQAILLLSALLLCCTSCLGIEGSGDDGPGQLESYGIDPESADSPGPPEGWPAGFALPPGASGQKSGSGNSEFGPYLISAFECSGGLTELMSHIEMQADALGHTRLNFELTPHWLSGYTASARQSVVFEARRKGGKLQVHAAVVEEYDEFFSAGRSVTYSDINALPPGWPSDRLPLMEGAKLESAYYEDTKMVELRFSVKRDQAAVRQWYRDRLLALGFTHAGEVSSDSDMLGDQYLRGDEGAMIEAYKDGGACQVTASYGDGTASIWD